MGRDDKNRDYAIETTYQGRLRLLLRSCREARNILIFYDPRGSPPGFNFAEFQRFTIDSNLNSVEMNFRISRRLGRDRMELNPCTGDRVRKSRDQGPLPTVFMGIRGLGREVMSSYFSQGAGT